MHPGMLLFCHGYVGRGKSSHRRDDNSLVAGFFFLPSFQFTLHGIYELACELYVELLGCNIDPRGKKKIQSPSVLVSLVVIKKRERWGE